VYSACAVDVSVLESVHLSVMANATEAKGATGFLNRPKNKCYFVTVIRNGIARKLLACVNCASALQQ